MTGQGIPARHVQTGDHMIQTRSFLILVALSLILAAVAAGALFLGGANISAAGIWSALIHPTNGDMAAAIMWKIRIPRIIAGLLAGMGLAAAGCVFQGMLRNPLADPYTLGISGGAAFGAAAVMLWGGEHTHILLPAGAFAGTLLSVFLVYIAAARRSFSLSSLILSGVIIGFLFSSLVLLMVAVVNPQQMQGALLWLMGDLSAPAPRLSWYAAIFIVPGTLVLTFAARELNVLMLGDEKARTLGISPGMVKGTLFLIASLITGACVALGGIIAFVGLIIPHMVRPVTGTDHRVLIPASALAGAAFLILCDALARTVIAPVELPVGVITGLAGGIFFLYLLFTAKETW